MLMDWGLRHRAKRPISAIEFYVARSPEEVAALDRVKYHAENGFQLVARHI